MKRFIIAIVFLVFAVMVIPAPAQNVPFDLQMKLILKILAFDRNFERYGDPIKIGVTSDSVLKGFNSEKDTLLIGGKKYFAENMASVADIPQYKVVYIDSNWAADYKAASAKATEVKALMFTSADAGVRTGGGAISVKTLDGNPKIIMAIAAAKAQGADFPATFLQLAVIIGSL